MWTPTKATNPNATESWLKHVSALLSWTCAHHDKLYDPPPSTGVLPARPGTVAVTCLGHNWCTSGSALGLERIEPYRRHPCRGAYLRGDRSAPDPPWRENRGADSGWVG